MNQHTIIGNLTRDPETGTTEGGNRWCHFTVAVNRQGRKDDQGNRSQETEFIRVTAWHGLADTCGKYLRKGRRVAVVGESRAHAWTGNDGSARGQIELLARSVEFLGGRDGGAGEPTDEDAPPAPADPSGMTPVEDPEDLPF